jgi:predicted TIM-barrel fold metal-dependent hydrolase
MRKISRLWPNVSTYPNFSVDVSARTQYFFQGDPQTIRQFVDKYQDRLIYGSDFAMAKGTDDRIATGVLGQENRQWSLFASNQKITQRNREIQGLGMPEPIVRRQFWPQGPRMVRIAPA